jgi:hypothetical protein
MIPTARPASKAWRVRSAPPLIPLPGPSPRRRGEGDWPRRLRFSLLPVHGEKVPAGGSEGRAAPSLQEIPRRTRTMLDWSEPKATVPTPPVDGTRSRCHRPRRDRAGRARVSVDDKRMINARADVNQLLPLKYRWAWEKYLSGCNNHWMPTEVSMQADIALWKSKDGLTEDERAYDQAQSRLLRSLRDRWWRTTSCWRSTAISPTRNAASICCGRPSKRRSTRIPSSTSSKACRSTRASCSTCTARCRRSPTRRRGR